MRAVVLAAAVTLVALSPLAAQGRGSGALDAAFRQFWAADDAAEIAAASKQVLATGATFEDIAARVKAGRPYEKRRTGRVDFAGRDHGIPLDNVAEIPEDYDPARRWPVRIMLHGGVSREAPGPGDPPARPLTNRVPSAGEIVIHPRGWSLSEWWTAGQVENITRLLDRVKREYNVDESRVYITGISDGGTGVYFLAMRDATRWAACLPLNGHPLVLANRDTGADGQFYAGNLANCPLYIVNGGRDRLYPAASVAPLIEMFKRAGVPLVFQVYPDGEHNVNWWPEERPRSEAFMKAHARVAHPDRISWETERTDRYNRFRWLVINRLGKRASDAPLADVNRFSPSPGREVQLFDRSQPSGRVDVVRKGNAFEASSRGVQEFTLLLSPDVVDLARPVRITVNGRVVHDAIARTDAATLLEWHARDQDRTMVYGAALRVTVP